MAKINLPFVQGFTAKGKPFYYFRKPGCARLRLPGLPGSPDFMAAYTAALAACAPRNDIGASRTAPGTVAALVAAFIGSDFKVLGEETQRTYLTYLNRFRTDHGDKPVKGLRREHIETLVLAGKRPSARKNYLKALRQLAKYAVKNGWLAVDPTDGITAPVYKTPGHRTWGEDEIAAYRATHPLGGTARLAMELLLCTCQRSKDVRMLGRQHLRANGALLFVRQSKTGTELKLPILAELRTVIDATPSAHLAFLTSQRGAPFSAKGFANAFRKWCDDAGLQGFSAHGLRKAACRRLAEAGATAAEIQAWSGHLSLAEVQRYIAEVDQTRLAVRSANKLATPVSN
jgi:integrase